MLRIDCWTVYTSSPTAGAMRGYGIPQAAWFAECLTDDMATAIGMDPYEFRMKNCMEDGFVDPANGITFHTYGLKKCMEAGKKYIHWDEKRKEYANQTGPVRRGVGMSIFCYKTGVYMPTKEIFRYKVYFCCNQRFLHVRAVSTEQRRHNCHRPRIH